MKGHQRFHVCVQLFRRSLQAAVVVLILGVAAVSLYAHYRAAHALDDIDELSGPRGAVLVWIDGWVSGMESPERFLDSFKGTLWSMRLLGWDLTDPLAVVEMTCASKTFYLPLFVSCLFWLLLTLLLGKLYCSWICPGYLLFELAGKLRKLLRMAEVPPAEVVFSRNNKYIVLSIGLLAALTFSLPLFALVYPPAVLSRIAHAWVFGTALTGMLVLMGLLIVIELFVSPRWWCRYMCPGGALFGLLGWPRLLRVKLNRSRCNQCGQCQPVCEVGLNPVTESCSIECDNCGQCARYCPEQALSFGVVIPGKGPKAVSDSLPGTKALLVFLSALAGLAPAAAGAHHILGLPHYSYKENYPQAPILEYPAQTGPYDVLLTSYPGKPLPGETANIAIYVKNRQTGIPYDQPVEIRVLQTFTFGQSLEVLPMSRCVPFDKLHKLSVTFPEDGEYIVELTMEVEGKKEVIPFIMVAGEPSATLSVLITTGIGMVVFLVIVRAVRIKRARRRRQMVVPETVS